MFSNITPETRVGPGGRDRTLAVKSRKISNGLNFQYTENQPPGTRGSAVQWVKSNRQKGRKILQGIGLVQAT